MSVGLSCRVVVDFGGGWSLLTKWAVHVVDVIGWDSASGCQGRGGGEGAGDCHGGRWSSCMSWMLVVGVYVHLELCYSPNEERALGAHMLGDVSTYLIDNHFMSSYSLPRTLV